MNEELIKPFRFKQFEIQQDQCTMKVGTDGVLLGAWVNVENAANVLDIGTGTGVIPIMIAQRTEDAKIFGVEIEKAACEQAKANMEQSPWAERLTAINTSVQDFAKISEKKFDLIVSNPPFFSGGTFSKNQDKTNVRHTVKLPHGDLLSAVRTLLSPNGKFCVKLPLIEGLRLKELALSYNLHCTKITEVIPRINKQVERLLMQFEKADVALEKDQLTIQKEKRNEWTSEYIELTKDFYLNM